MLIKQLIDAMFANVQIIAAEVSSIHIYRYWRSAAEFCRWPVSIR